MGKERYSLSEARGHPRRKLGELGVREQRELAAAIPQAKGAERKALRKKMLAKFGITHFDPEKAFYGQREVRGGLKGPRDWHDRRAVYKKIAEYESKYFGVERNETFALLFSP